MAVNPQQERKARMPNHKMPRSLLSLAAVLFSLVALVGCTMECPSELTNADKALAAAKQAGKDKECPELYAAAEKLRNEAHAMCKPCYEPEAIALAKESMKKTAALCPPKPAPPPPPPVAAKPPAPAVTVSLSASPTSVKQGDCSTLMWSSSNASSASIDQGVGRVEPNGSRKVCPDRTTQYTITSAGEGGSREASATVTVVPKVVDRLTVRVNFDFNKSTVKKADDADLEKAVAFVKKYPGFKISVEGYTDNIGSDAYNQALSERRAAAVKEYLVKHGVDAAKIQSAGHGESDPVADNSTETGRAENRRVEILILSE
jgi:outer membrane protein OmpA-like peptidoglycan-associated protein